MASRRGQSESMFRYSALRTQLSKGRPQNEPLDLGIFTGNKKTQAEMFEKLLSGVYLRPYCIDSILDLTNLTDMADYYRMLPIVSHTLSNAILDSQGFIKQIKSDPCVIFEAAAKLRHKVLFREALVWVVADWRLPAFKEEGGLFNPRLRQVARCIYGEIATMVSRSTSKILDAFLTAGCTEWLESFSMGVIYPQQEEHWSTDQLYLSERPALSLPKFFQNIVNNDGLPDDVDIDPLYLSGLLRNNLVLDQAGRVAGEGSERECFLCAKIEDEDLPWDPEEHDW
jgi:hypothetical protein